MFKTMQVKPFVTRQDLPFLPGPTLLPNVQFGIRKRKPSKGKLNRTMKDAMYRAVNGPNITYADFDAMAIDQNYEGFFNYKNFQPRDKVIRWGMNNDTNSSVLDAERELDNDDATEDQFMDKESRMGFEKELGNLMLASDAKAEKIATIQNQINRELSALKETGMQVPSVSEFKTKNQTMELITVQNIIEDSSMYEEEKKAVQKRLQELRKLEEDMAKETAARQKIDLIIVKDVLNRTVRGNATAPELAVAKQTEQRFVFRPEDKDFVQAEVLSHGITKDQVRKMLQSKDPIMVERAKEIRRFMKEQKLKYYKPPMVIENTESVSQALVKPTAKGKGPVQKNNVSNFNLVGNRIVELDSIPKRERRSSTGSSNGPRKKINSRRSSTDSNTVLPKINDRPAREKSKETVLPNSFKPVPKGSTNIPVRGARPKLMITQSNREPMEEPIKIIKRK